MPTVFCPCFWLLPVCPTTSFSLFRPSLTSSSFSCDFRLPLRPPSLLTVCLTKTGYALPCVTLTSEKTKNSTPRTALPKTPEKKFRLRLSATRFWWLSSHRPPKYIHPQDWTNASEKIGKAIHSTARLWRKIAVACDSCRCADQSNAKLTTSVCVRSWLKRLAKSRSVAESWQFSPEFENKQQVIKCSSITSS